MVITHFAQNLSDNILGNSTLTIDQANELFTFFKECTLFRWSDANNDCEDRANAICILLDDWNVSNCKGWVFSGYVFKKIGYLKNLWRYHVAAAVLVSDDDVVNTYVIDPATADELLKVGDWAANVTEYPQSFHLVKRGEIYIFSTKKIERDNWYRRNKRNYNWTMQGLTGINGLSSRGKAQLSFNKKRLLTTHQLFGELRKAKPSFLP